MTEIRTKIKILIVFPILLLLLTTYYNYEEKLILNELEGEHNLEKFEPEKRNQEELRHHEELLDEECNERNVRLGSKEIGFIILLKINY